MKQFKGITRSTQQLLDGIEGFEVDFKQSASIDAEDLVSFANHDIGGTLLLGVKEEKRLDGTEYGKVIGCKATDDTRLGILMKAHSCHPPIDVRIQFENMATSERLIRVDIPTGKHKPYCTSGGTYKIRHDGKNNALVPAHLLGMFVDAESKRFIASFQQVGERVTNEVSKAIADTGIETQAGLLQLQTELEHKFRDLMFSFSTNLEHESQQLLAGISDLQGYLDGLFETIDGSHFLMEQFADVHDVLTARFTAVESACARVQLGVRAVAEKNGVQIFERDFWKPRVLKALNDSRRHFAHLDGPQDLNEIARRIAMFLSNDEHDREIIKSLCQELLPTLSEGDQSQETSERSPAATTPKHRRRSDRGSRTVT